MKRLAILGTLLGAIFLSGASADAQVIYGRPIPLRRPLVAPYYGGYYYYGPRYYYGPAYRFAPRYYGGYWSPWGGYYW